MRFIDLLSRTILVLLVSLAVACQSLTPSLSVGMTEIVAAATGGKYEIVYSLEDIAFSEDDWNAQCDADWISGYDFSTKGVIVVDVLANELLEDRSAVITLSYSGVAEQYQVTVNQKAGSVDMSEIILEQDEVEVSDEGGEYTVRYTIKNPIVGMGVTVETNVLWIKSVVSNVDGEVTFRTSWNFAERREAVITVVYGDSIERSFKVIQQEGDPEGAFELGVSEIKQSTAFIEVTPADNEMYYTVQGYDSSFIETNYTSLEDCVYEWLDGMNMVAGFLGMSLEDLLRRDMLRGAHRVLLSYLSGGTEISALVFGLEPSDQSFVTDIFVVEFVTEETPMLDITFDVDADINGAIVDFTIRPSDAEQKYFVHYDKKSEYSPQAAVDYYLFLYAVMGYTVDEMIEQICISGDNTIEFLMDPNTDYVAYACTINSEGRINSEIGALDITTGDVLMSDNEIDLSVKDVTGTSAVIDVDTSNDDFYVVAVSSPKFFDGMTDDEAADAFIASNLMYCDMTMTRGDVEQVMPGLVPNTEYIAFAFGYYRYSDGYVRTSSPVKVSFTTTSEPGSISIQSPKKEKSGIELLDNEEMRKRFEMERYLRMLGR